MSSTLSLFYTGAQAHDAQLISDAVSMFLGNTDLLTLDTRERGIPVMHDLYEPECHAHHLCS